MDVGPPRHRVLIDPYGWAGHHELPGRALVGKVGQETKVDPLVDDAVEADPGPRQARLVRRCIQPAPGLAEVDGIHAAWKKVDMGMLINELAQVAHANQLSRALGRWERLDLICIDELGYVPLAETACELMFQVIADRAEKAAVILTTNLPFSEWSQVIPNARLCKALIDRLTDRAHIITTGTDSYRFRRTTAQRKPGKA